jgi:hypothetical protein
MATNGYIPMTHTPAHESLCSYTTISVDLDGGKKESGKPTAPMPCSGADVREAATHIAHHIESAGQVMALAIFFGLVIGGCYAH